MKSELNYRITICFIVTAIILLSITILVVAQGQSPPSGMDKGVWVLKEKKPDFEPIKDEPTYFNYHVSVSGNSAKGGWSWKDDPVKPECSGEVWGTSSWEEIPSVIQPGVGQNTTLNAEVGGSQSCAYRHVSSRTALYVNDGKQGSEASVGYATSDPKPAPVSVKVPWEAPWGKIGDTLTITVVAQVPGAISNHYYYNYIYTYEAKAPSAAPNISEMSPTMEKKGEPQKQAMVPEIDEFDESCPGKCIDSGAHFSSISKDVEVQHCWDDAHSRYFAKLGASICVGDRVIIGEDSNAIIGFEDFSSLMLKPESELVIGTRPERATNLELIFGRIKINFQRMLEGEGLEVHMTQTVTGIKGTTIVCEETGSSSILKVLEGTASFRSKATGEEILVSAGEMATATENGISRPQLFDVDAENASWEEFAPKPKVTGSDTGASEVIFNNWNTCSVYNSPSCAPSFTLSVPQMITYIDTYHWNYGSGTKAGGNVILRDHDGKEYGPWQVDTKSGQGGVPNAWWIAHPNEVIPAGTYGVVDSEQSTWSQNPESGGCGFSKVEGYPVEEVSKQKQQPAEITGKSKTISTGGQKEVGDSGLVATKDNSEDAEGWYAKGYNLARLGKYDEAVKAYDEAIRLDPKYENAWYAKGVNLKKLERYNEAIKAYDEAIRLDPKDAKAWCAKGNALDMQGKYDAAIENYDEAIRLDPKSANAWYAKGNALSDLGRYDEAINAYEEAIRLDPQDANARYAKGVNLKKQGKYDEAIKAYDEAIRLDPEYANAWFAKGNALKLLGRTTEADAAYAKAKELGYA